MEALGPIQIITYLVVVGIAVTFGARYARHKGHIQSRTAKLIPIVVIFILAFVLWIGPMLFLVTDSSSR
jgi:cytochrome bd-type quinol oxidase subunit 2